MTEPIPESVPEKVAGTDKQPWSLVDGVMTGLVSLQDRGLQYGDGLFETIACEAGMLSFWAAHYSRLRQGSRRLGMACPVESLLLDDIVKLLERAGLHSADCIVKIMVTRGCSERGYRAPEQTPLTRIVQIHEGLPQRFFKQDTVPAAKLCLCQHKVSINPSLAGLKHLNRLENVLARNEWRDEYHEGLMCDTDGNVIEGTMSNIFGIREGILFTPSLHRSGVAGIIRETIIRLAADNGIKVFEENLSLEKILSMEELFICNSLLEILPVTSLQASASVDAECLWQTTPLHYDFAEKINQLLQATKNDNAKSL